MAPSNRFLVTLALAATFLAGAVVSQADEAAEKAEKAEKKKAEVMTLKGEVVDTGCYLGHGAMGADHKSCALTCIAGGMPMGLLVEDTVYLLTMSHEDADPYNQAKKLAASVVEITGPVHERGGMKAIEVTAIKEVPAEKG
jgi:hypothetical protein